MRYFYIRKESKFHGEYPLYEGKEEFEKYNPGVKYYRWAREDNPEECIQIGNWVETEDGYITQILYKRVMREGHIFVKVPMGTFPLWRLKSGIWKWAKLYGQFANGDQYRANGKTRKDIFIPRFVQLVLTGVEPLQAYYIVKGKNSVHSKAKVRSILQSKEFIMEVRNQLAPFKEKLSKKITEDRLIKELESLLDNSRPGSQNHRENIKFIMELVGLLEMPQSKINNAKEIQYEEVPPPQLG